MTDRIVNILLCVLVVLAGTTATAQEKTAKEDKHVFMPPVYLGRSDYKGGPIKNTTFNSLLKQGLTCHDSLGNKYRVVGFDFGYNERNLYEDSVGNLMTLMDYTSEYCKGDTVSTNISKTRKTAISNYLDGDPDANDISKSIYERTKPGDTVYFDHIMVAKYINATESLPDAKAIKGRNMKFYFVK